MGLSREDLERLGGRTSVEVAVPTLGEGETVTLMTPSAFDREIIETVFTAEFENLVDGEQEEGSEEISVVSVQALRRIFSEAIAMTLHADGGRIYEDGEAVRKALRMEVVDELGQEAWKLFGLGQAEKDEALGNSDGSPVSDSPSG